MIIPIAKCDNGVFKCKHLKGNECAFNAGFLCGLPTDLSIPESCPLFANPDMFCTWEQEGEDSERFNSDCGMSFYFEDGEPEENEFKFCPKCGKPLTVVMFDEEEDGDE